MTKSYSVGLIVAPEFSEKIGQKLVEKLPESLKKHKTNRVEWKIEMITDPMTGAAETINEIFEKASTYKQEKKYDYLICLTDLPIFHKRKVVAADINEDKQVILLSIPAFGWFNLFKRIKHAIIYSFNEIDGENKETKKDSAQVIWRGFSISPIQKVKVKLRETNDIHVRYLGYPKINGSFRLLLGMTYANNPFQMMSSLTGVIAVAFTTGGFGMIFTTMWKLSHLFSNGRLSLISLAAIIGMVLWVIIAHELWEKVKTSSHKRISSLYNLTTISTLLIAVSAYYLVVFILFLGMSLVLIPAEFLSSTLELHESVTFVNYLKIAWFAASLSTMTGAIGVGLENEQKVRDSTYGYRQKSRYREMLQNEQK